MSVDEIAGPRRAVERLGPRSRWCLSRAGVHGLAGLDEVLTCAGGRLLLRGGAPASEVLRALFLPIDADPRRIAGNGVVWLEFAGGGERYVLGAVVTVGRARFFATPVPVGDSLPLHDPTRRPDAADLPGLVGAGAVFDDPADYLDRVASVFGREGVLGRPDPGPYAVAAGTALPSSAGTRLRDVVAALRGLREPARLTGSDGVRAVLPTLDPVAVEACADALAELDAARTAYVRVLEVRAAVGEIGAAHRDHLRALAGERTADLRSARTAHDEASRRLEAARGELSRAEHASRESAERLRLAPVASSDGELRARWRELSVVHDLDRRIGAWNSAETALVLGELAALRTAWERTVALAPDLALPGAPPEPDGASLTALGPPLERWRRRLRATVSDLARLAADTRALREGQATWSRARTAAHEAARHTGSIAARAAEAHRRVKAAEARRDSIREAHGRELAAWAETAGLDAAGSPEAMASSAFARFAVDEEAARTRFDALTATLREAATERAEILSPERAHGVPPWHVRVEFAPGVSTAAQAGLEAALEATGLLDARLVGDTRVSDPYARGCAVAVGDPVVGASLADVLRPVDGSDERLAGMLRGIGLGESAAAHWVGLDGRWRLGPVRGVARRARAEVLGAENRAAARTRRLERIDERIAELGAELRMVTSVGERVRRDRDALGELLGQAPDPQRLWQAVARVDAARAEATRLDAEVVASREAESRARACAASLREDADPERADVATLAERAAHIERIADRVAMAAESASRLAARVGAHASRDSAWEWLQERRATAEDRYRAGRGGAAQWPPPSELVDVYAARRDVLAKARAAVEVASAVVESRAADVGEAEVRLRAVAEAAGGSGKAEGRLLALIDAAVSGSYASAVAESRAEEVADPAGGNTNARASAADTISGQAESHLRGVVERHRAVLAAHPVTLTRVDGIITVEVHDCAGLGTAVKAQADVVADREFRLERWYGRIAADMADRVRFIDAVLARLSEVLGRVGGSVAWAAPSHAIALDLLRASRSKSQETQLRGIIAELVGEHPRPCASTIRTALDPRGWGRLDVVGDPLELGLCALSALYDVAGTEGSARLVALDGLGEETADEVLPLLAALDLDLLAAGPGLWGHVGTVRELDAYELVGDGEAVVAVRLRWNGTRTAA